jgi:hypothetical protein
MVWIFSRGTEQIRVESRYDEQTSDFVMVIDYAGGHRDTQRFGDAVTMRTWLSALEQQLEANGWIGPVLRGPRGALNPPASAAAASRVPGQATTATATRSYTSGTRMFEILLTRRALQSGPVWTVERVMEQGVSRFVVVPGMQAIASASDDEAFARACDCIDKWVWSTRTA